MKLINISNLLALAFAVTLVAAVLISPLISLICIAPLVGYIGYLRYLKSYGNLHEVIPSKLYRSGRLSLMQIHTLHNKVPIRSIINLLGNREGKDWYTDQTATAKRLGIEHIDFRISAGTPLSKERAQELIELMRRAPKPLLIHCKAGSDRSGLAAALYLAAIDGASKSNSESAISFRYGHIGLPYVSAGYAMKESWNSYQSWLGFSK